MFKFFNSNRVKFSEKRRIKMIQTNPVIDYLTPEEYLDENETFFRLFVIHPFDIIKKGTREKITLEIGTIIDIYRNELDLLEDEDWILVTLRNSYIYHTPLTNSGRRYPTHDDLAKSEHLANRYTLYDCTIPFDEKMYFWISWQNIQLEYEAKNSYSLLFARENNLEIVGNILGFIRFADKVAYKTFRRNLIDAIQKYLIIQGNNPSCYEQDRARTSLRNIARDLNNTVTEMNIVEPVYKSFETYLNEKQEEAIQDENKRVQKEKERIAITNAKRSTNKKLLQELSYKEDFFSELKNIKGD